MDFAESRKRIKSMNAKKKKISTMDRQIKKRVTGRDRERKRKKFAIHSSSHYNIHLPRKVEPMQKEIFCSILQGGTYTTAQYGTGLGLENASLGISVALHYLVVVINNNLAVLFNHISDVIIENSFSKSNKRICKFQEN